VKRAKGIRVKCRQEAIRFSSAILLLILLLSITSLSQSFPLERINISGSRRYSPQMIASALRLRTGQQTSQAQLEAASRRLTASGLFSKVEFRFGWTGKAAVVNFELRDNTTLLPVGFENFVWFSPNELTTTIKKRLPLFTGVVPLSGDFNRQILESLDSILKRRNIRGRVVQLPQGPTAGPPHAMFYRVDGHKITTVSADFPGAIHANAVALGEVEKYVTRSMYERSAIEAFTERRLKDIYETQGYLAAKIGVPEVRVLSSEPEQTRITLLTRVVEGRQYQVGGIQWAGNQAYGTDELTRAMSHSIGQVANLSKFRDQLAAVRELYRQKGYLRANFTVSLEIKTNATAVFKVTVHEGDQYRTGKVLFSGLDPANSDEILAAWKLRAGDAYDSTYVSKFMNKDMNKLVPEELTWEWTKREDVHEDLKTVDLYLQVDFKKREM
jgi:outer membrane protein assembly factor BamA